LKELIFNIFKEGELISDLAVKEYLTAQIKGSGKVKRKIALYNVDVIKSLSISM